MIDKYHDPAEGNRRHQQALARLLVAGLGRDEAIAACTSNGWQGVARALLQPGGRSDSGQAPRRRTPRNRRYAR